MFTKFLHAPIHGDILKPILKWSLQVLIPSVYNYHDPQDFLRDMHDYKRNTNPHFSVRSWAKQMGLKGHTSLVFFLKGERQIRAQHCEFLFRGIKLDDNQKDYLSSLVHLKNASSDMETNYYESKLKVLHPAKNFSYIDLDKFRVIADWSFMAILEMTGLKDFNPNPIWIAARLNNLVSPEKVTNVLNRLLGMGLLKIENGIYIKTNERLTTPKDRPSESIREHHKQVLSNAIAAIDVQDVSERSYDSCTMTIDKSRINEAKELIQKFRSEMAKLMEKDKGDETYQLSVQFFKLTSNVDYGINNVLQN
jgi:uncharacterized protein (TIGR02147 family)